MHLKQRFWLYSVACLLTLAAIPAAAQTGPPGGTRGTAATTQDAPQPFRGRLICKTTRQIDLSGDYEGVLSIGEGAQKAERAMLSVTGNEFSLESDSFVGKGYLTGTNSCGDTAFALRFTEIVKAESQDVRRLLASAVSLDATTGSAGGAALKKYTRLSEAKAFLLQTITTPNGRLGGPMIAFQKCPPAPCKAEDYPRCPDCVN